MNGTVPIFLSLAQAEEIHRDALAAFGGLAGVRDQGLVESALASAENTFWYGHGDLFDVAAAYAYHIAESQCFFDGNKRAAIGSALVFLDLNGCPCPRNDDALHAAMIHVAEKRLDKAALAALFRRLSQRN